MGRVLVVSASMGEGHDGAARELVRRLEARGHETRTVDFLASAPLNIGPITRTSYEIQLRQAPWSYQFTYRLWAVLPFLCRPFTALVSFLTSRRTLRWIAEYEPDVIVTTYNLSSLVLARLRRHGRLRMPVVTFVTDFDVHRLWVARGVDLTLCVHEASAAVAAKRAGAPARAPGPMVAERFRTTPAPAERERLRAELGLGPDDRGVLVVAGSWGVGDIGRTFDGLLDSGRYVPIAACGRNEELKAELATRSGGRAIGWTDQMPSLMAACDAIVENAGGLTCMEALAVGLPVVTYLPIPGHGRENGAQMERAGVAAYARSADELLPVLDRVTGLAGRRQVAAGRAMFRGDAADDVAAQVQPAGVRRARPSLRRVSAGQRLAGAAAALIAVWATFTFGVSTVAAHGFGVARAERHSHDIFVGVRLGPANVADANLVAALAGAGVTAIVDGTLADQDPAGIRRLTLAGVDVANGGWGRGNGAHWARAKADVVRACNSIQSANGQSCHNFVPLRRIDGFDLASARMDHQRVVANVVRLSPDRLPEFRAGRIYVLDARTLDTATVTRLLAELRLRSSSRHLTVTSFARLH